MIENTQRAVVHTLRASVQRTSINGIMYMRLGVHKLKLINQILNVQSSSSVSAATLTRNLHGRHAHSTTEPSASNVPHTTAITQQHSSSR